MLLAYPTVLFFAVLALSTAIRSYFLKRNHTKQAKKWSCEAAPHVPSGILGIKFFSRVLEAFKNNRVITMFQDMHKELGNTLNATVIGNNIFFTVEPENIQAILATQFSSFGLGSHRRSSWYPLTGNGIFTLDGAGWSHSRGLLRPQFTKEKISNLDDFSVHVGNFINAIPANGHAVDIQGLFFKLFIDSSTEFLLGESVNLLSQKGQPSSSEQFKHNFLKAFTYAQQVTFLRLVSFSYYWVFNPREFKDANKTVHQFVDYYVDRVLRTQKEKPKDTESKGKGFFLEEAAAQTTDRKFLRDQAVNVLLAAADDTSSLLSSVFYFLAHSQGVWTKLREEVLDAFGTEHWPKSTIDFHSMQELPYLRAVINEALRLLPPVPINARLALKDTSLPRGGGPDRSSPVYVQKDELVVYSVWALHRREDIWGKDAEEFRPERWNEFTPKTWDFVPFNGGPRACLGQQYALTQASYVIIKVLQSFNAIEWAGTPKKMGSHPAMVQKLTSAHSNGVHVRLYSH